MTSILLVLAMSQAPLEQRVEKLEKAASDAGRALLFRNEGFVNPPKAVPATFPLPMPKTAPAVAYRVAPVRTVVKRTENRVAWVARVATHPVKSVGYFFTPWRR